MTRLWLSALLMCSGLVVRGAAQVPEAPSWPDLPKERRGELIEALDGILESDHPARRERYEATVVDIGAAACPLILGRLAKATTKDEIALWTELCTRITGEENGPILTLEFERASRRKRAVEVTRLCARRLMELGYEPARSAIEAFAKKDVEDPDLRELVRVASFRLGTNERLTDIEHLLTTRWGAWREDLFDVLRARRSDFVTARGVELLLTKDRKAQLSGLRLLAGGGLAQAVSSVRPFLYTDDRVIQEATVNALAFFKNGSRPRHDIPVFELIELVNRWKGQ